MSIPLFSKLVCQLPLFPQLSMLTPLISPKLSVNPLIWFSPNCVSTPIFLLLVFQVLLFPQLSNSHIFQLVCQLLLFPQLVCQLHIYFPNLCDNSPYFPNLHVNSLSTDRRISESFRLLFMDYWKQVWDYSFIQLFCFPFTTVNWNLILITSWLLLVIPTIFILMKMKVICFNM